MSMLSRVADSLYWMSRYLERAEHTARLLDVTFNLMLDESPGFAGRRRQRLVECLQIEAPPEPLDDYTLTQLVLFDINQPTSIHACIASARHNAQNVREQISSEMWEQLNRLYLQVHRTRIDDIWNAQPHEFFRNIREGAHLFQGITDSTLSHGEGWQFIQAGRSLERARATALLLDVHFTDILQNQERMETSDFLEWVGLLKFCTAYEAYCKVYTADLRSERIVEFLLLDAEFPRSIRYSARMIHDAIQSIAELTNSRRSNRALAVSGRFAATLDYTPLSDVTSSLKPFLENVRQQCWDIHQAIYDRYVHYSVASAAVM